MDVSNASGYDGTTVAADACFLAKAATGRSRVVITEATNPQVRAVVKTFARGFGLEVVEVPHERRRHRPRRASRAAAGDAAAVIFQQPNFFGCLEPAPELAAAANAGGALPVAHVDLISLGVLEAPGNYGCALAIGEGQSAGNFMSYGGPHYGFLAAKEPYMRRLPGRIVGETVDGAGERGYVLTLQTREQHIRREKATSNITTNQTLLALAGLVHLSLLGPAGAARDGGDLHGPRRLRAGAARRARARAAVPRPADVQGVRARHRRAPTPPRSCAAARAPRRQPRLPARPRLPRPRPGRCSSRVTERRTAAEIDRLAETLAR